MSDRKKSFSEWWKSVFSSDNTNSTIDVEALSAEVSQYVSSLLKKQQEQSKPASSGAQYSMRESDEYAVKPQKPKVQFQQWVEYDPIPDYLRDDLTPSEARALAILLDERKEGTFTDQLLAMINEKGMRDSTVYHRAQLDRRLFSKIAGDRFYRPAKDTVIAFALALECILEEADALLRSAGYQFSRSSRRDIIIAYFFRERIYDLDTLNTVLAGLGEKTIGRVNVG